MAKRKWKRQLVAAGGVKEKWRQTLVESICERTLFVIAADQEACEKLGVRLSDDRQLEEAVLTVADEHGLSLFGEAETIDAGEQDERVACGLSALGPVFESIRENYARQRHLDLRYALEEWERTGFDGWPGDFVAIYGQQVVGSGDDMDELRTRVAAATHVPPQRIVIEFKGHQV